MMIREYLSLGGGCACTRVFGHIPENKRISKETKSKLIVYGEHSNGCSYMLVSQIHEEMIKIIQGK